MQYRYLGWVLSLLDLGLACSWLRVWCLMLVIVFVLMGFVGVDGGLIDV